MRRISTAIALVLVSAAALSLGSVAAGSRGASSSLHAVMSVTGHAPKGVKVTYGTFRNTWGVHPPAKFPFHTKLQVFDEQYSYFVSGQLKHGGKITCKLTIGKVTKVGHAKGGHKTCTARLTSDNAGGWH